MNNDLSAVYFALTIAIQYIPLLIAAVIGLLFWMLRRQRLGRASQLAISGLGLIVTYVVSSVVLGTIRIERLTARAAGEVVREPSFVWNLLLVLIFLAGVALLLAAAFADRDRGKEPE